MTKQNRETLKEYFKKGCLPEQRHFEDLIDSALNIQDDGFDRSLEDGVQIYSNDKSDSLISFFSKNTRIKPAWQINLDQSSNRLIYSCCPDGITHRDIISFDPGTGPQATENESAGALDIQGNISSWGRIGTYQKAVSVSSNTIKVNQHGFGQVPANGDWHPITEYLKGTNGFEIIASTGSKALLHAIALNAGNPSGFFSFLMRKRKIRCTQAYHNSHFNKLKLRWSREKDNTYALKIKTKSDYGDANIKIKYHITVLWNNAYMND